MAEDGPEFEVKDSGERQSFDSGMQRDTNKGKVLWHLIMDGPLIPRYAKHLTRGAAKYEPRNWMRADSSEERERFRESAFRHFMLWYLGYTDEDHASGVVFNMNGTEYVDKVLEEKLLPEIRAGTVQLDPETLEPIKDTFRVNERRDGPAEITE